MNATTAKDTMRLFYALWPDDATRTELVQVQTNFHGRLTRYENLHITLAFLGEQPASLLPDLKDILEHLPKSAMTLTLDRLGYFQKNRIAWAGMHNPPDALFTLQSELAQALLRRNVSFDSRAAFKPHVTLARDATPPADMVFAPITWQANQVALVQSKTQPDGVSYRVLASRSLDEDVWTPNELGKDVLDTGR
jgi:2'-5' RNA ligase